jgi:hypothetical protein
MVLSMKDEIEMAKKIGRAGGLMYIIKSSDISSIAFHKAVNELDKTIEEMRELFSVM